MKILSIDTSCDDTSVAITQERKILSNVIFSQVQIHAPFGGVYPTVAKREHLTKINPAVSVALKRARTIMNDVDAVAVTFGPGLAPALEVGVNKAKELAREFHKPLIPVDHIEGHIYSSFAQNKNGNPTKDILFPLLACVVSGGHTELVLMHSHVNYEIVGQTLDDAAGEALDKAARILGLGYPGGPVIEKLAALGNPLKYTLPIPMAQHASLDFSYSGLKTAFKRLVESLPEEEKLHNLNDLAATFQETIIISILRKLSDAMSRYQVATIAFGGGVTSNLTLRKRARALAVKKIPVYFPSHLNLSSDNAAMIGIAAYYKYQKGIICKDLDSLDRTPRAHLNWYI